MDGGGLYLWNSCEPSSPSVWTIRQCLKMAASLLNSAASSFRQHRSTRFRSTLLDLYPHRPQVPITSNKTSDINVSILSQCLYLIDAASAFVEGDVEEDFQHFHG